MGLHPLGILAVVGAAAVLIRAGVGRFAGRWYTPYVRSQGFAQWCLVGLMAGLVLLLWVRQQSIAELLMGP